MKNIKACNVGATLAVVLRVASIVGATLVVALRDGAVALWTGKIGGPLK